MDITHMATCKIISYNVTGHVMLTEFQRLNGVGTDDKVKVHYEGPKGMESRNVSQSDIELVEA